MKALVIAGGLPQVALIKELKKRNITTILADGSENAIARPYADQFFQLPIFDVEAVKDLAIRERVDFLITVCADQVLLVVAQISEMLGLPCYLDYETAQKVSDKEIMKKIFVERGIPTSPYVVMNKLNTKDIQSLNYPLVVKPVDSYSSKGVRKVLNKEELSIAFDEAIHLSRAKMAVIEEFCSGEEISVDVYVAEGKAYLLCVSNSNKIKEADRFVIFRGKYPAKVSETVLDQIRGVAQKIADVFNIKNAPMLIQLITDGKNISVLEFCARTGGAMKYLLIKHVCGFDVIKAVVDLTLGIKPTVTIYEPDNNYIVNDFIYCKPGVFDHLVGFQELVKEGILTDFFHLKSKGTIMRGVTSSSDRIAGITIKADSIADFNQKHKETAEAVQVVDNKGNDIMRHDLFVGLDEGSIM
jgi:carbamoylphosphate synthase large subunit